MKKVFFVLAAALLAGAARAQEPARYPSFAGFETNGFWDNWEISIGAGINGAKGSDKKVGYDLTGSLTKWVHPVVGVRGALNAGQFKNTRADWRYLYANFDAMINFSNWAGGYRSDRVYYAVPFAGMGLMHSHYGNTFALDAGLLNKIRLCEQVDFNIELKALLAPNSITPGNVQGKFYALSATAGFTYRFNRRDWERQPAVAVYNVEDIRVYQQAAADAHAALHAANAENSRLSGELKTAQDAAARASAEAAAAKQAPVPAATALDPSTVILYRIGSAALSPEEKVRLNLQADLIKQGPKNQIYTIEGHADAQTGTAAVNQRLSVQRAKAVYDYLVSQGVNPDQLRYEGMGDTHNPYSSPVANRVAIIK